MNQIIIACGLESEQLDMLASTIPEGYTLRVEDWVDFAVSNSSSCCVLSEDGLLEQIPLVADIDYYKEISVGRKVIWIGGYPPLRDFHWAKCFSDAIQTLNTILQEDSL